MRAEAVRYHEAGHATVARILGIDVLSVTARPTGKFRGLTCVDHRSGRESDKAGFRVAAIKVLLAGSLAEVKRFPESDWETVQGKCASDWFELYYDADQLVQILGMPRPRPMNIAYQYPASIRIVERLADDTRKLLEEYWAAVTRVAKALHGHAELKQAELDDLIAGRPIPRKPPPRRYDFRQITISQRGTSR